MIQSDLIWTFPVDVYATVVVVPVRGQKLIPGNGKVKNFFWPIGFVVVRPSVYCFDLPVKCFIAGFFPVFFWLPPEPNLRALNGKNFCR